MMRQHPVMRPKKPRVVDAVAVARLRTLRASPRPRPSRAGPVAAQPVGAEPAVVGVHVAHVLYTTNALRAGGGSREGPRRGARVAGVDTIVRSPGTAVAAT